MSIPFPRASRGRGGVSREAGVGKIARGGSVPSKLYSDNQFWLLSDEGPWPTWTSTQRLLSILITPRFLVPQILWHILLECSVRTHLCKGLCQRFNAVLSVFIAITSSQTLARWRQLDVSNSAGVARLSARPTEIADYRVVEWQQGRPIGHLSPREVGENASARISVGNQVRLSRPRACPAAVAPGAIEMSVTGARM